jgi:hypothetical protein
LVVLVAFVVFVAFVVIFGFVVFVVESVGGACALMFSVLHQQSNLGDSLCRAYLSFGKIKSPEQVAVSLCGVIVDCLAGYRGEHQGDALGHAWHARGTPSPGIIV